MPRKSRILIQIKVIDDIFTSFRQNINNNRNNECECWNIRCQWEYVRHSSTTEVQLFHVITKPKFFILLFPSQQKLKIKDIYFMISFIHRLTTKIPRFNELWTFMRQNMRPWSEFFNFNNFKTVANFQRLSSRFLRNFNYFLINYVMISFVLILYCLWVILWTSYW